MLFFAAPKRLDRSDVAISLSSSTSVFLTNDRLLLSLQSGDLFSIQFKSDGRQVYTVLIEKSGSSVHSSAVTFRTTEINREHFFNFFFF